MGKRTWRQARHRAPRRLTCTKPAVESDLDHHLARDHGGTTDADNLGPLCARHHQMKHEAGWQVRRDPDGRTVWIAPTGHVYARDPDPYPVDEWASCQSEIEDDPPPF